MRMCVRVHVVACVWSRACDRVRDRRARLTLLHVWLTRTADGWPYRRRDPSHGLRLLAGGARRRLRRRQPRLGAVGARALGRRLVLRDGELPPRRLRSIALRDLRRARSKV